jgi:hypothetical protein
LSEIKLLLEVKAYRRTNVVIINANNMFIGMLILAYTHSNQTDSTWLNVGLSVPTHPLPPHAPFPHT